MKANFSRRFRTPVFAGLCLLAASLARATDDRGGFAKPGDVVGY